MTKEKMDTESYILIKCLIYTCKPVKENHFSVISRMLFIAAKIVS